MKINSNGGAGKYAVDIMKAIQLQKNFETIVGVIGRAGKIALSGGFYVLQACHLRQCYDDSKFVLHRVSIGKKVSKKTKEKAKAMQDSLFKFVAERSRQEVSFIDKVSRYGIFGAKKAKKWGFVDKIIPRIKTKGHLKNK